MSALVTGAASGIGLALARRLAAGGEPVVLVDRDAAALEAARADLAAGTAVIEAVTADVTSPSPLAAAVAAAEAHGPLTTVCLNAGVSTTGPTVWETSDELLDLATSVNLGGLVRCIRDTVPVLIAHGQPARIVITASMAGLVASPNSGAYAASKAGAIAVAKALRSELAAAAPQITVTVVNPGMVATNLARSSAAQQPGFGLSGDMVEMVHGALNKYGLDPDVVAAAALDAAAEGRFWVIAPRRDRFHGALAVEVDELSIALAE